MCLEQLSHGHWRSRIRYWQPEDVQVRVLVEGYRHWHVLVVIVWIGLRVLIDLRIKPGQRRIDGYVVGHSVVVGIWWERIARHLAICCRGSVVGVPVFAGQIFARFQLVCVAVACNAARLQGRSHIWTVFGSNMVDQSCYFVRLAVLQAKMEVDDAPVVQFELLQLTL
jgi:hypothetical protein